jgi:hypothetical protein
MGPVQNVVEHFESSKSGSNSVFLECKGWSDHNELRCLSARHNTKRDSPLAFQPTPLTCSMNPSDKRPCAYERRIRRGVGLEKVERPGERRELVQKNEASLRFSRRERYTSESSTQRRERRCNSQSLDSTKERTTA